MRPVEEKALRLAITTAQAGGAALSGDETVDIYGTTHVWYPMTGASASGQKVVPLANKTHNFAVGDTVILIDISAPATYETDVIASISEGVSITLTNNNANAYATGDIVGVYQTEQIAVAVFGTAWTTLWYGQIAKLTFTGFDGTNTAKVDQPIWGVIWDKGNNQYQIDAVTNFGDGSTSSYFRSLFESVVFKANWLIKSSATVQIGALLGSHGYKGSYWVTYPTAQMDITATSTTPVLLIYASMFENAASNLIVFKGGTITIDNSIMCSRYSEVASYTRRFQFNAGPTLSFTDVYFVNNSSVLLNQSPSVLTGCKMHANGAGIECQSTGVVATNNRITNSTNQGDAYTYTTGAARDLTLLDPIAEPTTFNNSGNEASYIRVVYTCNINVCDKDGAALSGVTVDCEDTTATAVWAPGTITTDASGNITEQNIEYKRWVGTSETLTTYSPHKFTLSKVGYETLVMENVTIDGPIDWRLELQDEVVYPIEDDVRDAVAYGDAGTEFTGNLTLPAEADVENGVSYGAGGNEFTGTVTLPAEEDVETGVTYGAEGTEFTGTFVGGVATGAMLLDIESGELVKVLTLKTCMPI